ncbi:uncharacterized protein LOC108701132 isoform X2 [Xenopus laevis]|uniref:Uncharacterized protein LOC108701132 isoform X2 n=1 Tax=Xenopus laevis TaxID=8355 RepID=A0A8J1LV56_XENLA|nr:uncharacterized protein LOC108701132 isoform X2 [Xenopus laevis]
MEAGSGFFKPLNVLISCCSSYFLGHSLARSIGQTANKMVQKGSWDNGQMCSTNRWFDSELHSWLELDHLVKLVVTELENLRFVSDKEHRILKQSQTRLKLQQPKDIFHKGLQRLSQASLVQGAHLMIPFKDTNIQNSLELFSSDMEFWLYFNNVVSTVLTEFTDVRTLENSEDKLGKMLALKKKMSSSNFIFRVGLCLLKKKPLSKLDLMQKYGAGARLKMKGLQKLRAKRVKKATAILLANRQYPLSKNPCSTSIMAAEWTGPVCQLGGDSITMVVLPLDPEVPGNCLSQSQSQTAPATDAVFKNTKIKENLLEVPLSAVSHNALGLQIQSQTKPATATIPNNIKREEDCFELALSATTHSAFGDKSFQPQSQRAPAADTIPNNIKIEEDLFEIALSATTHTAFCDKSFQPQYQRAPAADTIPNNIKIEEDLFEIALSATTHTAFCDKSFQPQSQRASAADTIPNNIKIEEGLFQIALSATTHNACDDKSCQPQYQTAPEAATIPENIKMEEDLFEMPVAAMAHSAFGDILSKLPSQTAPATATIPENIKIEDLFNADCDGLSQQQPLTIPPVTTIPANPQKEGEIPAPTTTPNTICCNVSVPPVTNNADNTAHHSVSIHHGSPDMLVFLDCVKLRHRALKPSNAIEYYEQLQFANIHKVDDPASAVEAIHGAIQGLLNKILPDMRPSDTVELRLECGSLNTVLCSIRMSNDYSVAQSFLTSVVEFLQSNHKTLKCGSLGLAVIIVRLSTHNINRTRLDSIPYNHIIKIKKRWLYDLNQNNNNLSLASSLCALLAPKGSQDFMFVKQAQKIHYALGIPHDRPVTLSDIPNFEKLLNATIKIVYCQQGALHYHVTNNPCRKRVLFVYRHEDCYYGVKDIRAFIGVTGFCEYCQATFSGKGGHSCRYTCRACRRTDCKEVSSKRPRCNNCRVLCRSLNCLKEHKDRAASSAIQCAPKKKKQQRRSKRQSRPKKVYCLIV